MSEHVKDDAAGIAALPPEDPERVRAFEHAATCPDCTEALARGMRLMAMLDAAPAFEAPSASVLARTLAMIAEEPEPRRTVVRTKATSVASSRLLALAAVVLSGLFAFVDASAGGLVMRVGVECLGIELLVGAVPLAVIGRGILNGKVPPAGPTIVALTAWSALGAQAYLHFRCPAAHEPPHLAVFHFGGVLLATAIAAVVSGRFRDAAANR